MEEDEESQIPPGQPPEGQNRHTVFLHTDDDENIVDGDADRPATMADIRALEGANRATVERAVNWLRRQIMSDMQKLVDHALASSVSSAVEIAMEQHARVIPNIQNLESRKRRRGEANSPVLMSDIVREQSAKNGKAPQPPGSGRSSKNLTSASREDVRALLSRDDAQRSEVTGGAASGQHQLLAKTAAPMDAQQSGVTGGAASGRHHQLAQTAASADGAASPITSDGVISAPVTQTTVAGGDEQQRPIGDGSPATGGASPAWEVKRHRKRPFNNRGGGAYQNRPHLRPEEYEEQRRVRLLGRVSELNRNDDKALLGESHFNSVRAGDIGPRTTVIAVGGSCTPVWASVLNEVDETFPNYKLVTNAWGSNDIFHHRNDFNYNGKMGNWVKAVLKVERRLFPNAKISWILPFMSRRMRQRRGSPEMLQRLIAVASRELGIDVNILPNVDTADIPASDWRDDTHLKSHVSSHLMGNIARKSFGFRSVPPVHPVPLHEARGERPPTSGARRGPNQKPQLDIGKKIEELLALVNENR